MLDPRSLLSFLLLSLSFAAVQGQSNEVELPVTSKTMLFSYGNATKNLVDPGNTTIAFNVASFSPSDNAVFTWTVNEEEKSFLKSEPGVRGKMPYFYSEKEGNNLNIFLILDNEKAIPGNYKISIVDGEVTKEVIGNLNAKPVLPEVHKPKRVLEGDSLKLKCNAKAHPAVKTYSWRFAYMDPEGNDDETSQKEAMGNFTEVVTDNDHFITNDGALLTIKGLKKEDNGLYQCQVTNAKGSDTIVYYVNVKNRWAALWPFIGIVIEVAILVSAILLYERHAMKNKTQPDTASHVDQNRNNITNANNSENVPDTKDIRERNVEKT